MSTIVVTCPECSRPLKLRDPKLLGRRATCPKCQHQFVLALPSAPDASPKRDVPVAESRSQTFAQDEPTKHRGRKKRRNSKRFAIITGALLAAACVFVYLAIPREPVQQLPKNPATPPPDEHLVPAKNEQSAVAAPIAPREPIRLMDVPAGASIIINIHPARLWHDDPRHAEVRQCLGPFAEWIAKELRETCRFEPAEIDEAMVCLILGPRGTPPEVAAVVHLIDASPSGELEKKFAGTPVSKGEHAFVVDDRHAYSIRDRKTIAIAPKAAIDELAAAIATPAVTDSGIETMLGSTDRSRDFTIVFRPDDVQQQQGLLFPPDLQPLAQAILAWLGDEPETVAWSMQFDDPFTAELLVRNKYALKNQQLKPAQLEQLVSGRLKSLPRDLKARIEKMSPPTAGRRQLIGRLPAMAQAVALAAESSNAERLVRFSTRLPERAAPNLALAARLTWMETTRPGAASGELPTQPAPSQPAKPIADRLLTKIDVDFRRTPLEEALQFIGKEAGLAVKIDGKALQAAGYTRNMPQQFQQKAAPAKAAIHAIVKQYAGMVVVIDEPNQALTVTTQAAAEKNGWTVFPVAP